MARRDTDYDELPDNEAIEERKLLNKLVLNSFTANPATIRPFEQSRLSWSVTVPPLVSSRIEVGFTLDSTTVLAEGGTQVSPNASHAFTLTAHSPLTSRELGTQFVSVDSGACHLKCLTVAQLTPKAQFLKSLFLSNSITARGDIALEMLPPSVVRFKVPLEINIPGFFNADMNLALDVGLAVRSQNHTVRAWLSSVSVDVVFHWAEHILSLALATIAQGIMQPLVKELLTTFLGRQIETSVTQKLQPDLDALMAALKLTYGRTYQLYSIKVIPDGIDVLACPLPQGPSQPGGGGGGGILDPGSKKRVRRRG